jgi:hypothetical protein
MKADMFISKEFAGTTPYYQFAMAVAHELSHVVLDAINHPLRKEEKAVDLTAMLLGFSYLYRKGAHTVERVGSNRFRRASLGYLSEREIDAATKILVPWRMCAPHSLKRYAAALVALGVAATIGIFALATSDKHPPAACNSPAEPSNGEPLAKLARVLARVLLPRARVQAREAAPDFQILGVKPGLGPNPGASSERAELPRT